MIDLIDNLIDNYVNVVCFYISRIDSILWNSEGNEAPWIARPITELDQWLYYGLVLWYMRHLRVTDCLISHYKFTRHVANVSSQFSFVESWLITILRGHITMLRRWISLGVLDKWNINRKYVLPPSITRHIPCYCV